MAAEPLHAALRIAVLILGLALAMLPFQPAGSAEQVVTLLAAGVGLLFVGTIALLARLSSGRPPAFPPGDDRPASAFNGRSHSEGRSAQEKEGHT